MTQWVMEETRFREDEPVALDLIFTKGTDLLSEVQHKCPLGKSDHEVLQIKTDEECRDWVREPQREKKKIQQSQV